MNYSIFEHLKGNSLSGISLKEHENRKKIIVHLSNYKESTIPEFTDFLNISAPKVNELVMGMVKEGLIKDAGQKAEGIGRKANVYALNESSCYCLGVEIKKYKINIAIMGFDKTIVESCIDIPFHYLKPHESLEAIIKSINIFLKSSRISKDKIVGMGLSIAGRINVKKGEILTIYHFEDAR